MSADTQLTFCANQLPDDCPHATAALLGKWHASELEAYKDALTCSMLRDVGVLMMIRNTVQGFSNVMYGNAQFSITNQDRANVQLLVFATDQMHRTSQHEVD